MRVSFAVKRLRRNGLLAVLLIDQGRPLNSSRLSLKTLIVFLYESLVHYFTSLITLNSTRSSNLSLLALHELIAMVKLYF